MLPDFPHTKTLLEKQLIKRFKKIQGTHSIISEEGHKVFIHEGISIVITRHDGSVGTINPKPFSEAMTLDDTDYYALTPIKLISRIDDAAKSMGEQMAKEFLRTLDSSLSKAGRVFNAKIDDLSPEFIISALEKLWIDFDESGNPILPVMFVGPELYERLKLLNEQAKSDPDFAKRFDDMINQKKKEWHARESSRQLVG